MLLIACPYCGPRPEIEFRCGGRGAHRPAADPASDRRRGLGASFSSTAPTRRACTPSAGCTRTAASAGSTRCATRRAIESSRPTRWARRVPTPQAGSRRREQAFPSSRAAGASIARKPIAMRFDGRPIEAYAGDTAASALLANGIHLVGRSFKYHRPRGILSHGSEEPNALLTVDRGRRPHRAQQPRHLHRGRRRARRSARRTTGRRSASMSAPSTMLLSPLFAAGFYYKTFMWPRAFWERLYEPAIRAHGGPGPRAGSARPRPLSAPPRPLRRAGGRRRAGGTGCGAGGVARAARG